MNHSPFLAVRLFLFYNSLFVLTHQYLRKTLRLTFEEGVQMLKVWDFSVFVICPIYVRGVVLHWHLQTNASSRGGKFCYLTIIYLD